VRWIRATWRRGYLLTATAAGLGLGAVELGRGYGATALLGVLLGAGLVYGALRIIGGLYGARILRGR
jgi:hypothetical protein